MGEIGNPSAHRVSHQNGGSDEISVAGLSGALADVQTPSAHKVAHENGGSDEISVGGLSGALADVQTAAAHKASHQNGGSDEISVAGLSGALADAQTPVGHHTSHEVGGSDVVAVPSSGEGHITILPVSYDSITQGTWAFILSANNWLYGFLWNSSHNLNDQIDFKVFLAAGTYTFVWLVYTANDQGITSLLFDGVSKGTVDNYAAVTVRNVRKTITGIVVAASGLVTVSLKVTSKNDLSSDHCCSIQYLCLYRTA